MVAGCCGRWPASLWWPAGGGVGLQGIKQPQGKEKITEQRERSGSVLRASVTRLVACDRACRTTALLRGGEGRNSDRRERR